MVDEFKQLSSVTHYTEKFPDGLKTPEEIAAITGMHLDRVLALTEAHFIPHYRVDGGEPRYRVTEVKDWVAANVLVRVGGKPYPLDIRLLVEPPQVTSKPPAAIAHMPDLRELPMHSFPPGVYFLCLKEEVVYVGQSVSVMARVSTHMSGGKEFDRVYFITVPAPQLNDVEGALIRALKPRLNGNPGPTTVRPEQALREIGFTQEAITQ